MLDRFDRLGLVFDLGAEIVIPRGVVEEITRGPRPIAVSRLGRHRVAPVASLHPVVAAWDLGGGESEVLTVARSTPGSTAVIDDRAARRCAMALGVATFGTLRVILMAKSAGLISSAARAVQTLRDAGFFVSDAVAARVVRAAGEGD